MDIRGTFVGCMYGMENCENRGTASTLNGSWKAAMVKGGSLAIAI